MKKITLLMVTLTSALIGTSAWSSPLTDLYECLWKNPGERNAMKIYLDKKAEGYESINQEATMRLNKKGLAREILSTVYAGVEDQLSSDSKEPEKYTTAFGKSLAALVKGNACIKAYLALQRIELNTLGEKSEDDGDVIIAGFKTAKKMNLFNEYQPHECKSTLEAFLNE